MTTIIKRENKEIYRDGDKLVKVFDEKLLQKHRFLTKHLIMQELRKQDLKFQSFLM